MIGNAKGRVFAVRGGGIVSATTGTAYAGIRTDLTTYLRGATALAEGLSIRATTPVGCRQRYRQSLAARAGSTLSKRDELFLRNLHLLECQLDELWTFIHKKEDRLTSLEKLAEVSGDAWVWIVAFSPVYKLVPAWVVGKRTLRHARRLLFRLQSATDGHIPFFPSDALPHYADALLEVYGVGHTAPARTRGRVPKPRRDPPPDLCYAIVIKERAHGRAVQVTTRIVYGTTVQVEAALRASPVSHTINTYGVSATT